MKSRQRNDRHAKQVDVWLKVNDALTPLQLIQLLVNGVNAVHHKSLETLSRVTVASVGERILYECKSKFPELNSVAYDNNGFNFSGLTDQTLNCNSEKTMNALKELLLELLEVFGKITAEILTKYLHQKLETVTLETVVPEPPTVEQLKIRSLSLAKKKREQK